METKLFNIQGKEVGKLEIPEGVFGLPWNADLVHQVVTSMQANLRGPIANTKGRGEVRGGGKKPWQQKGTGRARHGSSRSPIWKGGGVTHGPLKEAIYTTKINRGMAQKAFLVALSRKYKDGEIVFVDGVSMAEPKAAEAKKFLAAFAIQKRNNAALVALPTRDVATQKSFRNFGNVEVEEVRNLNTLSILSKKTLFIVDPKNAFEILNKKI